MTDELTRAAAEASEALGMSVELVGPGPPAGEWIVEAWGEDAMGMPALQEHLRSDHAALAYLDGLETGARIQRERYGALVEAVKMAVDCWQNGHDIIADSHVAHTLEAALSQLEDPCQD